MGQIDWEMMASGDVETPDSSHMAVFVNASGQLNAKDYNGVITPLGADSAGQPNGLATLDSSTRLPVAQLPTEAITTASEFNNANELVQLGSDGKLPVLDGSKLTNVTSDVSLAVTGQTALTGAVTLTAGTNVSLVQSGQNITVSSSGGGGGGGTAGVYSGCLMSMTTTPAINGGSPGAYFLVIPWDAAEQSLSADVYWTSGSPTNIVIPSSGVYHIDGGAQVTSGYSGNVATQFFVNGNMLEAMSDGISNIGWGAQFVPLSFDAKLNAGDVLTLKVITNGSTSLAAATFLNIHKVASTGGGLFNPDNCMPWLIDIDVFQTPVARVGTWINEVDSALYSGCKYNSSFDQNDEVDFDVVLAAGTWDMEIMYRATTDTGILTPSIGSTALSAHDLYGADAYNQSYIWTGNSIATTGKYRLHLVVTGKGGGSSYGFYPQHIQFRRTA